MKSRDLEQQKALQEIRVGLIKKGKVLVVCSTGWGKGHLIKLISETIKTSMLVIVPRVNLVRDLSQRTGGEIFCATLGEKNIGKITIATKQSLKEIKADLIILDECHSYSDEFLEKVESSCRYLIGLTATPYSSEGYIHE